MFKQHRTFSLANDVIKLIDEASIKEGRMKSWIIERALREYFLK
jgi:hypothetical protein